MSTHRAVDAGAWAVSRAGRIGVALVLAAVMIAVVLPGAALAAFSHNVDELSWSVPDCNIQDIAVDEANEWVYVACRGDGKAEAIRRYDLAGNTASFEQPAPYIEANSIVGNPGSNEGSNTIAASSKMRIAVDNSPSVNQSTLFVLSSPDVNTFEPSGEYGFSIEQPVETTIPNRLKGVDIGHDGSIYVHSWLPKGRISKYTANLQEILRLYTFGGASFGQGHVMIRVDSAGGLWYSSNAFSGPFCCDSLRKFEPDQFTDELKPKFGTPVPERLEAEPSPFVDPNPLLTNAQFEPADIFGIDVDLNTDDLYISRGDRIEVYSRGTAVESTYKRIPDFGTSFTDSFAVALTSDNYVFASDGNEVHRFAPGDVLPDVHTMKADINEVGHEGATVHGEIELDAANGGTQIEDCALELGLNGTSYPLSYPCEPDPSGTPFTSDTEVSASTGETLPTGTTFHYRFSGENEDGQNFGSDHTFTPAYVLKTQTLQASDLTLDEGNTKASAKLNASFDPDGIATEYKFLYGLTDSYGLETEFEAAGSGSGVAEVGTTLNDLPRGKRFHYRVVATNENGTTIGEDLTFRTASPPEITGVRATEVTATSATLHASVNPAGFATDYHFEYGTTTALGQSAPASPIEIGSGGEDTEVSQKIENLQPGVTYHFRIVAENQWGQNLSDDTTFDFTPPNCPNNHVRQQTRSAYLPDCRAYELVSPPDAGAALLLPSDLVWDGLFSLNIPYSEGVQYINNQGFATGPSRFSYWGAISTLPGAESTVAIRDFYLATRTNDGWVTRVPSYQDNDAFEVDRQYCNEPMSLCKSHSSSNFSGYYPETSAAIFTADGDFVQRVPTNLKAIEASVPDADDFRGGQAMSSDFSHYAFSSNNVPFAPGGLVGGIGSAYDNDIEARTVQIISRLPNGEDIPVEAPLFNNQKEIDFRITPDGSHILMDTPAPPGNNKLRFLYMAVDASIYYDVSKGNPVEPIGMTRDGSKVLFVTSGQMPGTGDTDASVDLYMWREATDDYVLLSQGNGNGNTDECSASWGVSGCGVMPLTPERPHPHNATSVAGQDDMFAEESGDVYFYSPELLDGTRPGVQNQRNLYLFRGGSVQLVGTFDAGTEVERSQISPDGSRAAFLTSSRLTAYDNDEYDQVYTFEPATSITRCASCTPSGAKPTADVTVSQGGRFMTNDGRAFFASADSLVPRDGNAGIIDVYEYVDGRPQLITSGLAGTDFTGGSEVLTLFLDGVYTGLEHVSRDGSDVYFSTFDTLVDEDVSGEFVKFYDARTNGGFAGDPALGSCAAADECHGADSSPPTPPIVASDTGFSTAGNLSASGNCSVLARRAKKNSNRAKRLRRKASRSSSSKQTRRLRRRAGKSAKQARRLSRRAKACRRSSGGNG